MCIACPFRCRGFVHVCSRRDTLSNLRRRALSLPNGYIAMAAHLVDVTMFWTETSGGVRRYIQAKRHWLHRHTDWRHSVGAPVVDGEHMLRLPGLPLPLSGGYRMPWARKTCAHLLQTLRPDLIEAGDPYRLAWSALDAARVLGVPAVAFCHSNLEAVVRQFAGRWAQRPTRVYLRHLYRQFDLVLAPSEAVRGQLADLGVERVERQPLGVDTQVFHPKRHDAVWRASLGLPPGARLLVYTGRFAPEKHLDVLAAAVARLGAPYVLLAVGAGPTPPGGPRVLVRRFEHDPLRLAHVLASADLYVHAGDQETFGLAPLEAMACGVPVVARARGGLAELVDETVGQPVEGGDAESFAAAISACFSRDRAAMSAAARQRAVQYDWGQVMPQLFGHYRRLLAARQPEASYSGPCPAQKEA